MRPGLAGPRIGLRFATGAIVYVIVGYPIAAAALSILRPRPVARGDGTPTVSVIIACHNEVDVIGSKLANLCAIDYPSDLLEVVVVDDGSTDGTAEVAGPLLRGARLHRLPIRGGKAAAVNAGVAVTRGDIIVLSDATALLDSSALRELVRGFTDDEVGVISGRMTHHTTGIGRAIDLYWRYEDVLRSWETASGSTVGVNGNLFAVRRRDFEPLPAETVNDELTIALRVGAAGKRVIFEPRARVVDLPSQSMREEQGRRAKDDRRTYPVGARPSTRSVWTKPGFAWRLVSHKLLRPILPLFGAVGGISALLILPAIRSHRRLDRWMATGYVTACAAVGASAAGARMLETRNRHVPRPLAISDLVVTGAAASIRGLSRSISKSQVTTWQKRAAVDGTQFSAHVSESGRAAGRAG